MAIVTIGLIYAAFLGIGWLATRHRRDHSAADFIITGRALPLWLATLTMTATWVDGGYLLGTAEGVYALSVATGLQGGVCFGISLILGGVFFARTMRAHAFRRRSGCLASPRSSAGPPRASRRPSCRPVRCSVGTPARGCCDPTCRLAG